MTLTDPIGDFIIQIKNAGSAGKKSITLPASKLKLALADVLKKEGYISDVATHGRGTKKTVEVSILYLGDGDPRVQGVRRVSKPSRRVYVQKDEIRPVRQGHGTLIVSTPEGLITGSDARKRGIGGEVLFEIW